MTSLLALPHTVGKDNIGLRRAKDGVLDRMYSPRRSTTVRTAGVAWLRCSSLDFARFRAGAKLPLRKLSFSSLSSGRSEPEYTRYDKRFNPETYPAAGTTHRHNARDADCPERVRLACPFRAVGHPKQSSPNHHEPEVYRHRNGKTCEPAVVKLSAYRTTVWVCLSETACQLSGSRRFATFARNGPTIAGATVPDAQHTSRNVLGAQ